MDFKVDISLWSQPAGQSMPRHDQSAVSDFKGKLGFDSSQPFELSSDTPNTQSFGQSQPIESLHAGSQAVYQAQTAETENYGPLAHSRDLVELYALGLYAGTHLSHVATPFVTAEAVSINSPASSDAVASISKAPLSSHDRVFPFEATTELLSRGEQTTRHSLESREAAARQVPVQKLQSFLTQQWPERNFQWLRRGENGLELAVRDYNLAPAEQTEITRQLLQQLETLEEKPERVWVNGQLVWQRIINA